MPKIDIDVMKWLLGINSNVLHQQADDLTHEDSLLQLPFRGNCLNWVVGHMISSRDSILKALGEEPIWTDEQAAAYKPGSEPITLENREVAIPFDQLMQDFTQQHERITQALENATPELLVSRNDENSRTVAERIAFLHFHDSYHVGQTEYLRQLAGKNDKVI